MRENLVTSNYQFNFLMQIFTMITRKARLKIAVATLTNIVQYINRGARRKTKNEYLSRRQFIFLNEILSIWLSSLIHQGKRGGGTWPKLIRHRRTPRQESNFFGKQKIFARISDNKKIIQNLGRARRFKHSQRKGIKKGAGGGRIPPVFHLRKLKPNCSFTPSALPLEASLRAVSTRKNGSPYFFTSKI